jgi:2-methylisocitrate lyase-like PEP mutase family enzyme
MAPGAFDPMSAILVEEAGYEAVYLTGGGYSRASGYPDIGLLTMTEVVSFVDRVCDVVSIPVIADLDNGYGSALNVRRAVRAFERAGVAGFHIEDQVFPKKCGHYENKAVVSTAEMVGGHRLRRGSADHRADPGDPQARAPSGGGEHLRGWQDPLRLGR